MKKFLIEIPHGADKHACDHAIQVLLQTGSHFLTHAEWGCLDGVHKAWMMVEVDNKEQAKYIVPPVFREIASIIQLNHFTAHDIIESGNLHGAGGSY